MSLSAVEAVDVALVEGESDVAVMEVAGLEVSAEAVTPVVAVLTVLEGEAGVEVALGVECVGVKVVTGVVLVVRVYLGCVVDTGVEVGSTLLVDVKVLVGAWAVVVDVGAVPVLVGVTEDVNGGTDVVPVVTGCVVSLVGFSVVFQVDVA